MEAERLSDQMFTWGLLPPPAPTPTELFNDGEFFKLSKKMFLDTRPPLLTQKEPAWPGVGSAPSSGPPAQTPRVLARRPALETRVQVRVTSQIARFSTCQVSAAKWAKWL